MGNFLFFKKIDSRLLVLVEEELLAIPCFFTSFSLSLERTVVYEGLAFSFIEKTLKVKNCRKLNHVLLSCNCVAFFHQLFFFVNATKSCLQGIIVAEHTVQLQNT